MCKNKFRFEPVEQSSILIVIYSFSYLKTHFYFEHKLFFHVKGTRSLCVAVNMKYKASEVKFATLL